MSGGDSFAGLTVPEGEPAGLNTAADNFTALSGTLSGVSADLRGMPGTVSTWSGPASVSFAGACMTNGTACHTAVEALRHAAQVAHRYSHELHAAQERVRQAIKDARDAQHRIDQAQTALTDARGRHAAATATAQSAAQDIMIAGAAGLPSPGSEHIRSQAESDRSAAAADEAAAARALQHARDDLERAKRRGHHAMDDARDAGRSAAAAFAGVAQMSPAYAALGGPAAGGGHAPGAGTWWDTTNEGNKWWDEDQFLASLLFFHPKNDAIGRYKWWGDQATSVGMDFGGDALIGRSAALRNAAIRDVQTLTLNYQRQFVAGRGGTVLVESLTATRGTSTVIDADLLAKSAKFGKAGKALPLVGGALAIGSAGYDQWREDSGNKNLTTTDRVGRAAGVGTYVGGASIAGAAIGTMIFPGVGTVAGLAIGATAGLVTGAIASSITPVKAAMADAGQWTANAAVDSYHWTGDRMEDVARLQEDVNRKVNEGVSTATDWVKDHTPHVDLPDLNPF